MSEKKVKETSNSIYEDSLRFHSAGRKGKIALFMLKPLMTQRDLALAYSPGVAAPCEKIAADPSMAYEYTSKGNIVAVISNGTAILGLGDLGPLASKPVMEGKAVLFKRFADVDSFDIEIDTKDPDEFVNIVSKCALTWGGINLEDIKAPECFIIEEKLQALVDIPVFHDDQHGTAIVTSAAFINACHLTGRKIEDVKIVVSGAGSAAIACTELLKKIGVRHDNVLLCDSKGVIYKGRTGGMNHWKEKHAVETDRRTIAEALVSADMFLGLSVPGVIDVQMISTMAAKPIIFACANPEPEITPDEVLRVRPDAIVATGRSDYKNQVNNIMGFPYIFRGALDVQARTINDEMKIAAANAIAQLAREPVPAEVYHAYSDRRFVFGPEYIIPVPFDPRLIKVIPSAVAGAAMKSGVARKPIADMARYQAELVDRLNPTGNFMSVLFEEIKSSPKRIIFAEGDEEMSIRAAIQWYQHGYGTPVLVGYREKIESIFNDLDYSGEGIEITNATVHHGVEFFIADLYQKLQRKGQLRRDCARMIKRDRNVFASMMLQAGEGDAMLTGLTRNYTSCLEDIDKAFGKEEKGIIFGLSVVVTNGRTIFVADTAINEEPSSEQLAEIAMQAAKEARAMGHIPRVAFLSHSNFGNPMTSSADRIRRAVEILDNIGPDFEYDGEMSTDIALDEADLALYPFCRLSKPANVLIMPELHSASIASKMFSKSTGSKLIGPILCGARRNVQILQASSTISDILNMAVLATIKQRG